jgi:hypothetical protein
VCTAPCDRPLAEHEEYRVGGPGVRPSLPFTLEGHGGRVRVAAQVASSGWFTGGVVLAAIGATTAAAGVVVATIVADLAGLSQGFSPPIAGVQAAGITMIAVGAVALGCGIVALAENTESRVELRGEDPTSQAHGVAAAFPLPVTVPAVLARF